MRNSPKPNFGGRYKRFPEMIVCGEGPLITTFLKPTQIPVGNEPSSYPDPANRLTHAREYDRKVERANCRAPFSERSSSRFSFFWRSMCAMRSP